MRIVVERGKVMHYSAMAAWSRSEDKTLQIVYSGPINQQTFIELDRGTAIHRRASAVAVETMENCVAMYAPQPTHDLQAWPHDTPPSSVIVTAEQYEGANDFCRMLARSGILRMCWLPHRRLEAQQWLEQFQD